MRISGRSWFLGLVWVVASVAEPAAAQLFSYPAKFVCGFELGDVRLLSDTSPLQLEYEQLKPGNYATLINLLNNTLTDQTVTAFLVTQETNGQFPGATFPLASFSTFRFGCPEIAAILGPIFPVPLTGQVIEGYAVFVANTPNLRVDDVFTFESKDAFKEHLVWVLDEDGQIKAVNLVQGGFKLGPFPPIELPFFPSDIAASGAGGLGVGASIDVEHVEPTELGPNETPAALKALLPK